jgi:hypothetical protein
MYARMFLPPLWHTAQSRVLKIEKGIKKINKITVFPPTSVKVVARSTPYSTSRADVHHIATHGSPHVRQNCRSFEMRLIITS